MEFARIMLVAVCIAVGYGIVHDQVTIRASLEYFTVGHPQLIRTSSPTVLGLFWGVVATWWVGVPLGFLLASAARNGRRWPKVGLSDILPRLTKLVGVMSGLAAVVGCATFLLVDPFGFELPRHLSQAVPLGGHRAFLAVWTAHITSYVVGVMGGLVVVLSVLRDRRQLAARSLATRASGLPGSTAMGPLDS